MSYQAKPGGAATGPRGQHGEEAPLGIEVREQPAEIALVGAVAVNEQQHPGGLRRADDLVDERHPWLPAG